MRDRLRPPTRPHRLVSPTAILLLAGTATLAAWLVAGSASLASAGRPATPAAAVATASAPPAPCPDAVPAFPRLPGIQGKADAELVPPGATSVMLCYYQEYQQPHLAGHDHVTDPATVRSLSSAADSAMPAGEVQNCPLDRGDFFRATFTFADAQPVRLFVDRTGCRQFTNGAAWSESGPLIGLLTSTMDLPPLAHTP